ncbi:hypothetical protein B4U80_12937 [Leptotrombidium deliense]|uniref:Hemopexin-like protein n=1 Tax=Leptotrombidium deliense TaxID=299467 RepID=A0A443SGU6_9ACAR|nr:hypothetical protein B4U80_12937 [Leptotrombidium deliense]
MRTFFILFLRLVAYSQCFDPCDKPKIDALLWAQRDGVIYIFNDAYFWEHDVDNQLLGPKKLIKDYWPEVETPIDSVTDYDNSTKHILFFKGFKYWAYASKQVIVEKNQKLVMTGTFASLDVRTVDAIQVQLEFPEDRKAVVCDGKQIFFCSIQIDEHMIIEDCESHNQYRSALQPQSCEAICKYDDRGWFVASGQTSYVVTNGTVSFQFIPIKQDVFQCKEKIKVSMIILIAGCGLLGLAIVVFVFIIVVQKIRQKDELPDEISVTEDETKTVTVVQPVKSKSIGPVKSKSINKIGKKFDKKKVLKTSGKFKRTV